MSLSVMGNFGRVSIRCWWDANAYDESIMKEWVDEIAAAMEHYLGPIEDSTSVEARL